MLEDGAARSALGAAGDLDRADQEVTRRAAPEAEQWLLLLLRAA